MVRMRKYLLPALVCAAIGALVLLLLERGEKTKGTHGPVTAATVAPPPPKDLLGKPAETRTPLDEHKWLRELQRSLDAKKLDSAMYYRQRVCEDMAQIIASEKLSKDLLDTIRKYGIESDDLAQRDVTLPILRVFENAEATRMIGEEYYRAKNEGEQMTLLEAMAKPYHDPKQASVWAVDKALNSDSAEHRERAFDVAKTYIIDDDLLVLTAIQVYDGSMDERQRGIALKTSSERGRESSLAREFCRRVLRTPSPDDIMNIMASLANWGDDEDAARLEQLANEFPAMGDSLRDQARLVRRARRDEAGQGGGDPEEMEYRRKIDEERRARTDAERKKREEEGAGGDQPPPAGGG
jgi:hypothetical protein